jgi:hypothetical protein
MASLICFANSSLVVGSSSKPGRLAPMDPVSLFLRKLLERIDMAAASQVDILTSGNGITDISHYREKVGYIRAMHDVVRFADETRKELMRPDDEQPNPNRAVPQRVADRVDRARRAPRYEA